MSHLPQLWWQTPASRAEELPTGTGRARQRRAWPPWALQWAHTQTSALDLQLCPTNSRHGLQGLVLFMDQAKGKWKNQNQAAFSVPFLLWKPFSSKNVTALDFNFHFLAVFHCYLQLWILLSVGNPVKLEMNRECSFWGGGHMKFLWK